MWLIGLWILFDAYAPPLPPGGLSVQWLLDWGEIALIQGIAVVGYVFRGEWDAVSVTGWAALVIWLVGVAVVKRTPVYSRIARLLLSRKKSVVVTPDGIAFGGARFESEAIGQLAVMQHQDLGMETMRDQSRREAGRKPRGKGRYFQNAFEVVMPYHGQPIVVASIYGSKLAADQVAARIMLVRQLAVQGKASEADADDFGPSPSLPDEDEETAADAAGGFWRRMGGRR